MAIFNQKGNVLLFAISGIAMIAALAMGMFYMTSTSSLGQAGGSGMNRAYYLALAGKDYALANWSSGLPITGEFILSDTERFELSKTNFKITSTGIVNRDTPFEAKKTIVAQSSSPVRKHFFESFEDLTKWATGTQVGGFQAVVPPSDTDKALDVTSSSSAFGSGKWSFLQLKTGTGVGNAVDFSPAWLDAGRCLSYDLQVKIANIPPQLYYMAGLIFKVSNSGDEFYGVSYLRANRQCSTCFLGFCKNSSCVDNIDDIPSPLKPSSNSQLYLFGGSPTGWSDPLETVPDGSKWIQYSKPAIVLWKRQGATFNWLAYKLMTYDVNNKNYVINSSNLLINWSNLQVRLIEAYPLGFNTGGPTPLLHGAVVVGGTSGASARISGTPIITSGSWAGDALGKLTLTTVSGTFQSGENLLVNGVTRAIAAGTIEDKTNYIRVYYGDEGSHGADSTPIGNTRGSNPRNASIHWPVDNVSDWAGNDYMTLVQWAGTGAGVNACPSNCLPDCLSTCVPHILGGISSVEANAIIQDSSLLTPNNGTINYSGIALHATGDSATSTYFDDFAIQY